MIVIESMRRAMLFSLSDGEVAQADPYFVRFRIGDVETENFLFLSPFDIPQVVETAFRAVRRIELVVRIAEVSVTTRSVQVVLECDLVASRTYRKDDVGLSGSDRRRSRRVESE